MAYKEGDAEIDGQAKGRAPFLQEVPLYARYLNRIVASVFRLLHISAEIQSSVFRLLRTAPME